MNEKRPPQSLPPLRSSAEAGNSLIVAMITSAILVSAAGLSMYRTTGAARGGARATSYASASRAADGALEYAFGVWKAATVQKDGPLVKTISADNAILTGSGPSIPGYAYTTDLRIEPVDAYGSPANAPERVIVYLPGYPGWRGSSYNYLASLRLQPTTGPEGVRSAPAGAKRLFQYTEVPLFQAMYFYEHDLEIYRPAPMIVQGLVHTNSRLLISGSKDTSGTEIEFQGQVSHAGGTETQDGYTTTEPPLGGPAWAGIPLSEAPGKMEKPKYSNGGEEEQVSQVERYEPLGKQPATMLDSSDSNPNNDSFRELVEPPVAGHDDPPEISRRRLYNKAGIVMVINGTTATITTKNGASLTDGQKLSLRNAFTGKTTIYDQREGRNVDVSNINISAVTSVLNAAAAFNGILYVHDTTPLVESDTEPKTIRLQNGGILPNNGLTVASENPVYIQGDYNTGTTTNPNSVPANSSGNPNNTSSPVVSGYTQKPAAVMADAVMLLSNAWKDSNASDPVGERAASNTTYNTAILAGVLPSGFDPDGSGPIAPYGYSGGANNYPRFLESWSGRSCTYFGSMVELFTSKVFTGKWDTGVIYRPPNRRWNFEKLFITDPPPGSLDAVAITRGTWIRL
jgi:hypothetical protein